MRLSRIGALALGLLAFTFVFGGLARRAQAYDVSWTNVGTAPTGHRLAACESGKLYALHTDGQIYANGSRGRGDWTPIYRLSGVRDIACADATLYILYGSNVWRNDGSDDAVRWTWDGRVDDTVVELDATRVGFLFGGRPQLVALHSNDRIGVRRGTRDDPYAITGSTRAADGGAFDAVHVSAVNGYGGVRLFAIDTRGQIHMNVGQGCNPLWTRIARRTGVADLAASSRTQLYALEPNGRVVEGRVAVESEQIVVTDDDLQGFLRFIGLRQNRVHLDQHSGTYFPAPLLRSFAGLPAAMPFDLPEIKVPFAGARIGVWLDDVASDGVAAGLNDDGLFFDVSFEEEGSEVFIDTFIPAHYHIDDMDLRAQLGMRANQCGQPELVLDDLLFSGRLSPGSFMAHLIEAFANPDENQLSDRLARTLERALGEPDLVEGVKGFLLALARYMDGDGNFLRGRTFTNIDGWLHSLGGGQLFFQVER